MKLLMWHCSSLASRDVRRSTRPTAIRRLLTRPVQTTYSDVLAVFACVEEGDSAATIPAAAREVAIHSKLLKQNNIVVVPFAHLSSNIMTDSTRARELIIVFADELSGAGLSVQTNSFGFHKEFELHFKARGHPGAVAFRDVPPDDS
jgi:threonyl-tRNA synthetase